MPWTESRQNSRVQDVVVHNRLEEEEEEEEVSKVDFNTGDDAVDRA
jgi:hypothetical protein